ncbi:beta-1,2-xylosyltransferase isoform X2 [Vitis riparia]|uniref:beta-1,2-xylosyltransferase isoform X2 n=1 Tax=Vitis riparia TaxID=96939 RepID=UPI00155A6994|nr:beta-1,2-xylosyltransferase isoform X2 [Vitis riparia]
MNRKKLKILLSLFAFNSIYLYFFSSDHHLLFIHHKLLPGNHKASPENPKTPPGKHPHFPVTPRAKPWPILPSYLPWSLNPTVALRSCEGYFGNGFTRRIDLRRSSVERESGISGGGGWFRCWHSGTLQSSVCEGGRVRMTPERIQMSIGGERLENVIGRKEEEELPEFEAGAFEVDAGERFGQRKLVDEEFLNRFVPQGAISRHTMRGLLDSIRLVGSSEFKCDQAPLEETWKALFSSLKYAKNFSGSVCFRHAVLVPLGYETALFKGLSENINCHGAFAHDLWQNPDDLKTARLSEFGEMIRAAFGFPVGRHRVLKPASGHNILFVRREDYVAHPRHGGKVESRLSNEQEVFDSLKNWTSNYLECKINLVNGLFAHMSMKEQVRAIQDASVIIGAHGAGLTHIISARPKTVILEIISSQYRRPHFALISQWKGLEYHAINLDGSYADPRVVIDQLNSIVKSLGC